MWQKLSIENDGVQCLRGADWRLVLSAVLLGGSGNSGWGLLLGDLLVFGDVLRMVVVPGLALSEHLSQFLSCEVSKFFITLTYTK